MTGRYPRHHGVLKPGQALARKFLTLAEVLQEYGFATGGFTSNSVLTLSRVGDQETGFNQGFDVFRTVGGIQRKLAVNPKTVDQTLSAGLTHPAIAFVREHRDKPFFLWMLHLDPHFPYSPPRSFSSRYEDDPRLAGVKTAPRPVRRSMRPGLTSRVTIARHMGEVSAVDHWLGVLIEELDNLDGKTLLIVLSDHGESLGDAGVWYQHGPNLRHPCINVPFIMACEGVIPVGVSDALVGNADIALTILDLLGIPSDAMETDGRSLMSTFTEDDPWPDRMIPIGPSAVSRQGETWRAVRSKHFSLQQAYDAESGDRLNTALFDLRTDPKEADDISRDYPDVVYKHAAFLDTWLGSRSAAEVIDLSDQPEMRERLQALGYLE